MATGPHPDQSDAPAARPAGEIATPAARLQRLAALAPGVLGDDGEWLSAAIRRWLAAAHLEMSFEAALGVVPEWWRAAARSERDAALCRLATELSATGDLATKEVMLRCELRRYQRRWDRTDRWRAEMPATYIGTIEAHLYRIFAAASRIGKPVPLSPTQLRKILSSCHVEETPNARDPIAAVTAARESR